MRPLRIILLVVFLSASLFLFYRAVRFIHRQSTLVASIPLPTRPFQVFSVTTPFSLFPPNAAISLTDDNSTFFPARPAAFGPPLPAIGLSGQLWIGTGFADDNLQDGEGEGELGCSDVAGWEDGRHGAKSGGETAGPDKSMMVGKASKMTRGDLPSGPATEETDALSSPLHHHLPPVDDGTDDYLHQAHRQAILSRRDAPAGATSSNHADIQSIQETAEITGRVVLLSRGGCGFLEKVRWAQRRGAVALIVGDNVKGGPLIQMYARGDVNNITIPAIFTSRTTAHLLSSLMQSGSFVEDVLDGDGNTVSKAQQPDKHRKTRKMWETTTAGLGTQTTTDPLLGNKESPARDKPLMENNATKKRWLRSILRWGRSAHATSDRNRPPSSGQFDWVVVDEWNDEKDKLLGTSLQKAALGGKTDSKADAPGRISGDSFKMGDQDLQEPNALTTSWRTPTTPSGPEEFENPPRQRRPGELRRPAGKQEHVRANAGPNGLSKDAYRLKGGSITPSSGEYLREIISAQKASVPELLSPGSSHNGLISGLFGDDQRADIHAGEGSSQLAKSPSRTSFPPGDDTPAGDRNSLWVTLTPTSSASPLFDTLLVLVVSPLITLAVVYALLLLRARIRRRRWRAPKSVVERLPVRTYQTVASSPGHSPRLPSPSSSLASTPLLQEASRSRPRSQTTTGIPGSTNRLGVNSALQDTRSRFQSERQAKPTGKPSEWKRYMWRQIECVVCLEEYIDGVSQVMSLPCGHEFHAECITPWLTTRRRTCPICKGDVVRSLARARGSPASPRNESYHDDSDEATEASSSAAGRSFSLERGPDVERGVFRPAAMRGRQLPNSNEGWFHILANGLGAGSSFRSRQSGSDDDIPRSA